MIVQALLDWISQTAASVLGIIPPMPSEVSGLVSEIESAVSQFAGTAAYLSPLVPFELFSPILAVWTALMGYWLAYLVLRVILWAVNR